MTAVHILPNVSKSKGNQTMEYGQLIEKKFLLKNHAQNEVEKPVPDPVLKNKNWACAENHLLLPHIKPF